MTKAKPKTPKSMKTGNTVPEAEHCAKSQAPGARPETAMQIARDESKTWHQQMADIRLSSVVMGTVSTVAWTQKSMGDVGINEALAVVQQRADEAAGGDLEAAKRMLMTQATVLDAIFNELASKAAALMKSKDGTWTFSGQSMEALTRIAFKAQSQCRGTLQTLGELVNPRSVAFIKQANMANGPQQVNNGADSAPAKGIKNRSNELKGLTHEGMDEGTQGATGAANSWLATVGAINRATVGGGQGEVVAQ